LGDGRQKAEVGRSKTGDRRPETGDRSWKAEETDRVYIEKAGRLISLYKKSFQKMLNGIKDLPFL